MTASRQSVRDVGRIILKYLPSDRALAMLAELGLVWGNKSFTETIKLLRQHVEKEVNK